MALAGHTSCRAALRYRKFDLVTSDGLPGPTPSSRKHACILGRKDLNATMVTHYVPYRLQYAVMARSVQSYACSLTSARPTRAGARRKFFVRRRGFCIQRPASSPHGRRIAAPFSQVRYHPITSQFRWGGACARGRTRGRIAQSGHSVWRLVLRAFVGHNVHQSFAPSLGSSRDPLRFVGRVRDAALLVAVHG